ncbi:hypothetical protein [Paludisphaera soli]|uniref:hypothetical protein n=1 Tax=Paludisphaera soli TaxID=2712865 RepID=UPI0013EC8AD4|nr:hypothetical protein [Paludisphaera soli]
MKPPDASNPWSEIGRRALSALAVYAVLVGSQVDRKPPGVGYGPRLASIAWQAVVFALVLAVLCLVTRGLQPDLASQRAGQDRERGPLKRSAPFLTGDPGGGGGA